MRHEYEAYIVLPDAFSHAQMHSVTLEGWSWTEAATHCVVAATPSLRAVKLAVRVGTLDDSTLTALMLMGARVRKVSADTIKLQSYQHADKLWPWDEEDGVYIEKCDVASLARLPYVRGKLHRVDCQE